MMKKVLLLSLAIILASALIFGGCPAPAPAPPPAPPPKPAPPAPPPKPAPPKPAPPAPPPVPKVMTWSAYDVGSSGYMMCGFIAESIMDKYGTKVRIVPAGSDLPRVLPLRAGDIDAAFHGLGSFFMQEGLYEYGEIDWGPQPVRYLWSKPYFVPIGVRGDSDIKTAADLKGKKLTFYPSAALNMIIESHLAFAGLTWDDVEKVDVSSYTAGIKMIMEGKIDAGHISNTAALAYEMAAMPYGLRFIELPHKDTEGWKKVKAHSSAVGPVITDVSAAGTFTKPTISAENPLETVGWAYPVTLVYEWSDEDMAYFLTKAIHETYDMFLPKHEVMKYWTIENHWMMFDGGALPLHKGAIRYFKELGMWTPEREAMNKERIEHQAALKKVWDAAYEEALDKGIKAKEFPKLWFEKRAAAGF